MFSKVVFKNFWITSQNSPIFSQIFFEIFWGNYRKFRLLFSIFFKILLEIFQNITQNFLKKYSISFEILFEKYENREYRIWYVALRGACHVAYDTCHCDIVICDIMLHRSTCSYCVFLCNPTLLHIAYPMLHLVCCIGVRCLSQFAAFHS